jgi:hypothetical protein
MPPKRTTQEDRDASYRRGWTDSLRAYAAMHENRGPSPYDYNQGWWDCARERWRNPTRRGAMPEGAPIPQSQAEYRASASGSEPANAEAQPSPGNSSK